MFSAHSLAGPVWEHPGSALAQFHVAQHTQLCEPMEAEQATQLVGSVSQVDSELGFRGLVLECLLSAYVICVSDCGQCDDVLCCPCRPHC